jgi:hypothetical protein
VKPGPHRDDLLEYPGAIGVTGVRRRLVAFLREIGEQEIADHGADIEADRADEGEFRIDDPRVAGPDHANVTRIFKYLASPWAFFHVACRTKFSCVFSTLFNC